MYGNATYQIHALISLRIQDTGLLDWLNATLKNGFDKTAGGRVTFCGCVCFELSFARDLPSSLESRARSQIRFSVRNSLGLDSRWSVREYSQPLALRAVRICSTPMGSCLLYSGCLWLLVVGIPKLRRASLNQ